MATWSSRRYVEISSDLLWQKWSGPRNAATQDVGRVVRPDRAPQRPRRWRAPGLYEARFRKAVRARAAVELDCSVSGAQRR
eukprot:1974767-Prymnesium_polylepis.1